MQPLLETIYQAVLNGERDAVEDAVIAALNNGVMPAVILNDAMIAAMGEVGSLFEKGDYFVPEMLISARTMQTGIYILKPYLKEADVKPSGIVIIGTVKGDLHDIGKNLVAMMLEGAGFEIIDLGTNVAPETFIESVNIHHPDVVGLSALLTTTMPSMKQTIEAFTTAGVRNKCKVIVGGAPVTEEYARQIGADGYSPDASRAVTLVKNLLGV